MTKTEKVSKMWKFSIFSVRPRKNLDLFLAFLSSFSNSCYILFLPGRHPATLRSNNYSAKIISGYNHSWKQLSGIHHSKWRKNFGKMSFAKSKRLYELLDISETRELLFNSENRTNKWSKSKIARGIDWNIFEISPNCARNENVFEFFEQVDSGEGTFSKSRP